jgi:uroporphyrinogen-III synthase
MATLRSRGALPAELQLYRWDLSPDDAARVHEAIVEIVSGRIDAALFTTQVQVRHVFDVAERHELVPALLHALREQVIVGAVGPTSAAALRERGIEPDVVPEHPKMGHLVVALTRHINTQLLVEDHA